MTDAPAAFRATYSDWKLIRTRKCVQIVLEIPLEESDIAYQVLGGMPNPAAETWCAVARLRPVMEQGGQEVWYPPSAEIAASGVVVAPSTPAPAPESLPPTTPARATNRLVTRSAILCGDPMFQLWLRREKNRPEVFDQDTAAVAMRHLLGIISRREIIPGSDVEARYNKLVAEFEVWAHPDIIDETPEVASIP